MQSLLDQTYPQLAETLAKEGEKSFRASQIFNWLYQKRVAGVEEMSNLSQGLQNKLSQSFTLKREKPQKAQQAKDGTIKFLTPLADGLQIETVILRHGDHNTVCLSTQVGCGMGCRFCLTAKMGLKRDLTPGEIVAQVLNAYDLLPPGEKIRNLVYMGMGEPFHNYERVIHSLMIFTDPQGFAFSWRRITVSTSGLIPEIIQFGKDQRAKANLAISLNGVTEEARQQIMPITKKHSLTKLIQACEAYPAEKRERITFEYVLLQGVTDSLRDAKALVKLLSRAKAKVNLIPFNPHSGLEFAAPTPARVKEFQEYLLNHGLPATLRSPRGQGISAACGQLAAQRKKENETEAV